MKTLRKTAGNTLIAAPFVALYIHTALKHGWIEALAPFAIAAAIVAVIGVGVMLTSE